MIFQATYTKTYVIGFSAGDKDEAEWKAAQMLGSEGLENEFDSAPMELADLEAANKIDD